MKPHENILQVLEKLDDSVADSLESETLEFKSWKQPIEDRKGRIRRIREAVVAMANSRGGAIVLGVADRTLTRAAAIHGVGDLDADLLRRDIHDGTDPHILVDIEPLDTPQGRVLVLRVPRGIPPHTTAEGVAKIRVGKESKPLTGSNLARVLTTRGRRDLTAEALPGATWDDLDPEEFHRLRRLVRTHAPDDGLARLADRALVEALGLGNGNGDDITLAAVLFLGKRSAIARFAPRHEVIFLRQSGATGYDARRDLRDPLLSAIDAVLGLLDAHTGLTTVRVGGAREQEFPDVGPWVAREALLNALTHRDYFASQSVMVSLRDDRVEVASPGGFPNGVTVHNVIRHAPVRRNPLVADVFQRIGLVNRAGLGVDRIHTELLLAGKARPSYTVESDSTCLSLPTRTNPDFVRFLDEEASKGREFDLDDLLILDALRDTPELDRSSGAIVIQSDESHAGRCLVSLRERGYLSPRGRGPHAKYRLATALAHLRRRPELRRGGAAPEAGRLVLDALSRGDRLSNADVRNLTGLSRQDTVRLMGRLREEGLATLEGTRRGARYLPGPELRPRRNP